MPNPLSLKEVSQCELCDNLGERHVPSEGSPDADVMFVGQSPGDVEVENGLPFQGPSGELFDYMLDEAGLDRSDVYIANALKCQPPGNRKGTQNELWSCYSAWLRNELRAVDPSLVVCLGTDAHLSVVRHPTQRIKFEHMAEIHSAKRVYLVSYHPAFFLRRGDWDGFLKVGRRIREIIG